MKSTPYFRTNFRSQEKQPGKVPPKASTIVAAAKFCYSCDKDISMSSCNHQHSVGPTTVVSLCCECSDNVSFGNTTIQI